MTQGSTKCSIVLLAALFWLTGCERSAERSAGQTVGTATVIDGDSLTIGQAEIRLWGIDAVELYQTCQRGGKSWPCGQAGKQALTDKIAGQSLTCQHKDIDRYGRVIAECYGNGESINAWLVRNGWALAYRRYSEKFVRDETAAKAGVQGIWQSQFVEPWIWRQQKRNYTLVD